MKPSKNADTPSALGLTSPGIQPRGQGHDTGRLRLAAPILVTCHPSRYECFLGAQSCSLMAFLSDTTTALVEDGEVLGSRQLDT